MAFTEIPEIPNLYSWVCFSFNFIYYNKQTRNYNSLTCHHSLLSCPKIREQILPVQKKIDVTWRH